MTPNYTTLDRVLSERYSCRAFRPDPVPRADIEAILRAAQKVPSWCNAQPWRVEITEGEGTQAFRAALLEQASSAPHSPDIAFPEGYSAEYKSRRQVCGFQLYEAVGIERHDRAARSAQMMQNFHLFGAPHVAVIHSPRELGTYGTLDCGGFVTAFTLAAQALGVASIPQAALASYAPFLHRWFGFGDDRIVVCAISFGYADPDHPANSFRTERAPTSEWVRWHDEAAQ